MSDNIKVVVKVRPLISREIEEKLSYHWRVGSNALYLLEYHGKDPQCFTFDKVYDEGAKTSEVYEDIAKPIVESAVAGINGTIFAYGQTSSGKTYTMTGTSESPGIIPLSVRDLFKFIESKEDRDFLLRVSYIEIYNDTIKDLLNARNDNIKIRENIQGVRAEATEKVVSTFDEVVALMKEGEDNRQIGATNMNEKSSRSHSIFQITIESREHVEEQEEAGCVNVSQLNLVDLAGSERAGQTGATGKRFIEGTHINKSLTCLALVIKQLSEGHAQYVNYRDSKLTRILQNSLGGNAKTSIICAVTPATVEETISTLQFASRAKNIKNKPEVNAVATNATMIQKLTKQLSKLQLELVNKKDLEKDNRILTEKIQKLRRQIINGFSQNPRDLLTSANRRKTWCAPRRMTIDAVPLSVIEEDVAVTGRFNTPLNKFNPLTLPSTSSLNKVRSELQMSRLSEESSGKITPPASERKVCFDNEIIEIDSDEDEDDSVIEVCSPIHGCYESKTPPCVLRHKVKHAEKNYKQIVKLAEREKQYPPPISELLQKLDKNTDVVRKMEDQINELNKKCDDKESEMDKYKLKITDSEKLLQDKNDEKTKLEATCKELNIKLTDLEVSYETLSRKAKLREEELLSLLEEQKQIQNRRNGKPIERNLSNFMDISKDISLVNSDNENEETPLTNIHETVLNDQQKQIANKDKLIQQLESEIITFKNKIAILEKTNEAALNEVGELKNKINDLETTNLTLSTSNDTLQSLIKTNEVSLASANEDLKSYSDIVSELNGKLEEQNNLSVSLKVEMLNLLLEAEEQIITNNEDTNHIFTMLEKAIKSRNKEIMDLKSKLQNVDNIDTSKKELEQKLNELDKLSAEKDSLQSKNDGLTILLSNLEIENKEIQKRHDDVKIELHESLEKYCLLEKEKKVGTQQSNLQENYNLNVLIAELRTNINTKEMFLSSTKADLQKALDELHTTNSEKDSLKFEIDNLNMLLKNLKADYKELQKSLESAKDDLKITKDIKNALELSNKELSDIINDLQGKLNNSLSQETCINTVAKRIHSLLIDLTGLETEIVNDTNAQLVDFINNCIGEIEEKVKMMAKDFESHQKYTSINEKYEKLKDKVLEVTSAEIESKKLYDELLQQHNEVTTKFREITRELESKIKENQELKDNVERLTSILQENERIIKKKIENESEMLSKIENQEFLYLEIDVLNKNIVQELEQLRNENESSLDVFHKTITNKDALIATLNDRVKHLECCLDKSQSEISETTENTIIQMKTQHELLQSILDNIVNIIKTYNITVDIDLSDGIHMYNQIPSVLHDIGTHIHNLQNSLLQNQSSDLELQLQSNTFEINHLKETNCNLVENLKQLQEKCEIYSNKIITIERHNDQLSVTLKECDNRIAVLTDEVREKSTILDSMEHKAKQLKATLINNKASETFDLVKPDSLISICCNKVSEVFLSSSESTLTPASSKTQLGPFKARTKEIGCQCETLNSEHAKYQKAIAELERKLEFFQIANRKLIQEQGLIREELKLLIDPSHELKKKLLTHKTHLSSLTATTYAETQLLKSQVKHLEHHHKRAYHLCQRDIPDVKKQLNDLYDLLKTEYLYRDTHNSSFKRYSLPTFLECDTSQATLKNDSTLDGDMLMLDANVTLATSTDTLTCLNQTCLDETQTFLENLEVPSHSEHSNTIGISKDTLENVNSSKNIDVENTSTLSPAKAVELCQTINNDDVIELSRVSEVMSKYKILLVEFNEVKSVKTELEERVTKLSDQVKNCDTLLKQIKLLEKEIDLKETEIKMIQEENNQLSTEVMDNVTEVDDLKKEVNDLNVKNSDLTQKCTELDNLLKTYQEGNSDIGMYRRNTDNTRNNKFSTLQNELHASREDCRKINEEVITMKYQLERSNLSISQAMDIDESMNESNIFTFTKDFDTSQSLKSNTLHYITEDKCGDYSAEKSDCINYYFEITGADKENFNRDFKIIDVMKLLHNSVLMQHSNELQKLTNKLLVFEESQAEMESQITAITSKYSVACQELENNAKYISEILKNTELMIRIIDSAACDGDKNIKLVATFKENVLNLLDTRFALNTTNLFEALINQIALKHQTDIRTIMDQYTQLQGNMETVANELKTVNINVQKMQLQLTKKEEEYNKLKVQKDKIQEMNNAVTMDVNHREQKLNDMIMEAYQKLIENNIVVNEEFDFDESLTNNVNKLIENLINKMESLGRTTSEKEKVEQSLNEELLKLKDENKQLSDAKNIQEQSLHDLNKKHETILQENSSKTEIIDKLHQQMAAFKMEMSENIKKNSKEELLTNMMVKIESIEAENNNLRALNECIAKEKSDLTVELAKTAEIIECNKIELENMTKRLSELNETVNEKLSIIKGLKSECQALCKEHEVLKEYKQELTSKLNVVQQQCDTTGQELNRLKMNIKTHEKTAEIQAKMISRLQKHNSDDAEKLKQKDKLIDEMNNKCAQLQLELETVQNELETTKESLSNLQQLKDSAEARVSELEAEMSGTQKDRTSLDLVRRRRQSLIDSKRGFYDDKSNDASDHNSPDAVFASRSTAKPDDLFMDVDDNGSNRSTPTQRRRDSILQQRDSGNSDDKPPSRPSSVSGTRRRRQSVHDKLRSTLSHAESLQDRLRGDNSNIKSADSSEGELTTLKERLQTCQQELEELKERCRELDEECDMCAQCLQERDDVIAMLRKEKRAVEQSLSECKAALNSMNPELSRSIVKPSLCDASVNTDADWANLRFFHSVVVDRMSFDAEVEKNKKLVKAIEEQRHKNHDLQSLVAQMQRALDMKSEDSKVARELAETKQELEELRDKYKEMDAEYDTCVEYLREREEQCHALREAKTTLEARLLELQEDVKEITKSSRKKRQSIHDQNRDTATSHSDAATETIDEGPQYSAQDIALLNKKIEALAQEKLLLEQQLAYLSARAQNPNVMYVATGSAIVQNQQISDLMKENQKLKRMNAKLVQLCQKRGKSHKLDTHENEPSQQV